MCWFRKREADHKKYLIVGLGNIGAEYHRTRHNIGFRVLDSYVPIEASYEDRRYGAISRQKLKNKQLLLLKPSTFVNLSGNAVRYWMKEENIPIENVLIVVDDLALSFSEMRLKHKGGDGGHNGLNHIARTLGTTSYARLRLGIGHNFSDGQQVNYVLSPFTDEEEKELDSICERAREAINSFVLMGVERAMNIVNTHSKTFPKELDKA